MLNGHWGIQNSFTHIFAAQIMNIQATEATPVGYIPAAKLPALSRQCSRPVMGSMD